MAENDGDWRQIRLGMQHHCIASWLASTSKRQDCERQPNGNCNRRHRPAREHHGNTKQKTAQERTKRRSNEESGQPATNANSEQQRQPTKGNMRNMPKTRDRQQPQTAAKAREDGKVDGHMMEAGRPVGWWYGGGGCAGLR